MDLKFINWRLSRAAPEQSRVQVEGALGSTMISSSSPLTPNNDDTVIPKVLRAYIHGVGQKADCMGSYTVYIINIYCDGDSYQVERRYSEFHALNVKIRTVSPDCSSDYKFPPKALVTFRNRRSIIRV